MTQFDLTDKMMELLEDCYEREIKGMEPCRVKIIKIATELIANGLVEMKSHNYGDGRKAAYFITEEGRKILRQ